MEVLSANLSQKQERRAHSNAAGSRSRSDHSRRGNKHGGTGVGHGLPLPKPMQSKRLAEAYRRESRKYKTAKPQFEAEILTPESKSRKEIP